MVGKMVAWSAGELVEMKDWLGTMMVDLKVDLTACKMVDSWVDILVALMVEWRVGHLATLKIVEDADKGIIESRAQNWIITCWLR